MDIYVFPPDKESTEAKNVEIEAQTAVKQEVYTKEEVEKLLEEMLKKIKESEVQ